MAAWCRDVLYVVAGHMAQLVVVSKPRQVTPSLGMKSPDEYTSHTEFKAAANEAAWRARSVAARRYAKMWTTDRGAAERFLSSCLRLEATSNIALSDPITDRVLSKSEMVEQLVTDLMARAKNDFPQDDIAKDLLERDVASIRSVGACRDWSGAPVLSWAAPAASATVYHTDEAINRAITSLKVGKACMFGVASAVKATCAAGRRLTHSLMNLCFHVCLTSTHWSLRKFTPIRKAGPRLVRSSHNLRPISICSEMAQVQDALWMQRNVGRLRTFCGSSQAGGVLDPVSLVVALVLLGQLREYQGLATYLAATDMKWGFDVAIITGMLHACHCAGVVGRDWLLIDDVMHMDRQVVELHGLLSPIFILGCGTAQGRRFSTPIFNSLLRFFADALVRAVPGGTCALLPPFAREALVLAAVQSPPASISAPPSALGEVEELVRHINAVAAGDTDPWWVTKCSTVSGLAKLPKLADRALALEQLGSSPLGPVQYVDDATTPCPSIGAVHAVLGQDCTSATSRYARWAKASFNTAKAGCLPLFGSPPPMNRLWVAW